MLHDSSLRFTAVLNAAVVLVVALLQLSLAGGRQIDHERVQPWGCRTCPIPAPATGEPGGQVGLSAAPSSAAAARGEVSTVCDGNCPGWVEMLVAACGVCPAGAGQAESTTLS